MRLRHEGWPRSPPRHTHLNAKRERQITQVPQTYLAEDDTTKLGGPRRWHHHCSSFPHHREADTWFLVPLSHTCLGAAVCSYITQHAAHTGQDTHNNSPKDVNTAPYSTKVKTRLAHGLVSSRVDASPSPPRLHCGFCIASLTMNRGTGVAAVRHTISKAVEA